MTDEGNRLFEMARRKKQRKQTSRGPGINPRALQIVQRKFGGRRPDRGKVFQAFLHEARRALKKPEYQVALELVEQAAQLAQSEDEKQTCDSLLAQIYAERASSSTGQAKLDDLELAVQYAPVEPSYRARLARALEQNDQIDEALTHYQAANDIASNSQVGYLWSVAALEAGRPLPKIDLSSAAQNTLGIVQHLVSNAPESARLEEPVLDSSLPLWQALAEMLSDEETASTGKLKKAISALDGVSGAGVAHYYLGVAALRAGDVDTAREALTEAKRAGYTSPWLQENLGYLTRARVIPRAEADDWQGVIDVGEPVLSEVDDRILAETVSLAHFHIGYQAAQTGDWTTAVRHWQQAERYDSNRYLAQNLALAREQQEDWAGAAEAWRDLIRRRPRKEDHPDHLDDNQVAGIWRHAAECYKQAGNPAEAATCLQNGLKHTPDDIEMRFELSDALLANEQFDAAENELNRILERDPDNVEAMVRLGQLYDMSGQGRGYQAIDMLEKAIELDPRNEEARDTLGIHYIEQAARFMDWGMYDLAVEQYRQGLEYLPDYALLHVHLGVAERHRGNEAAARESLLDAYDLEPDHPRIVGLVLHELLHLNAGEDVERLLPEIRETSGVLPAFWIAQGEKALMCKLGQRWVERFFEEAVTLVDQPWVSETRAEVLADIMTSLIESGESTGDLGKKYRRRIDQEVPQSGAKEFVNGLVAALEEHNWDKAERLLGKAQHKARKANEKGLLDKIRVAQELVFAGPDMFYTILSQLFN